MVKSKAAKRKSTQQQTGGANAGVPVKVTTLSEMAVALIDAIAIHGIDGVSLATVRIQSRMLNMNYFERIHAFLVVLNFLHFIYGHVIESKIDKVYKFNIITVENDANHCLPLIQEEDTDELTPPTASYIYRPYTSESHPVMTS